MGLYLVSAVAGCKAASGRPPRPTTDVAGSHQISRTAPVNLPGAPIAYACMSLKDAIKDQVPAFDVWARALGGGRAMAWLGV